MSTHIEEVIINGSLFRAILAVVVVIGAVVIHLQTGGVPDWLQVTLGGVFGFYFGKENTLQVVRALNTPVP